MSKKRKRNRVTSREELYEEQERKRKELERIMSSANTYERRH
ncbi:hypothetical protein [Alicyclobacillus dauci]|uniref:Fur-regulated basic protein B n=1 Tax=Alicyclobacillus dauci TaxID=1475485 RepID=A0ABY6Z545_9BACL|nr:hypothetical protein [Alicyclobacillus dauci]WAH37446.1 hypothetical protein NZD86_02590 [Alicyclobacillus dauci]